MHAEPLGHARLLDRFADDLVALHQGNLRLLHVGENLFLVRNGRIYTTPKAGILEGITRDSLITLAADLGYAVIEEPISRDQLYIADEVFVCGTAAEVVALREIDFRTIGAGKTGRLTRALQAEFDKLISGRHARSAQWLSLVPALNQAAMPGKA